MPGIANKRKKALTRIAHQPSSGSTETCGVQSYFDTLLPGFHDAGRISYFITEQYDEAILNIPDAFQERRDACERRTKRFASNLANAFETFQMAFPDMNPTGTIHALYRPQILLLYLPVDSALASLKPEDSAMLS
jgi:hypothetical protein